MEAINYSDSVPAVNRADAQRWATISWVLFIAWFFVAPVAVADSVMGLPGGGENIMVTFDDLDVTTSFPLTHRGVTYTPVEANGWSLWVDPALPVTRFVKSPMLALVNVLDVPGEPPTRISLRLDFQRPTQFFGFSLGFNSLTQVPDGSVLPAVGTVSLDFSNGGSRLFPLSASRVLCCTETRFDYSDMDDGIVGNGLVRSATITLDYSYEPFAPGSGFPGTSFGLKFLGIDDVTYSTAEVPVPVTVAIDIKPGQVPNLVNLKSNGFVGVAVLTEGDFDALQVDPESVQFGPGHAPAARYRVADVDRDGDDDLLVFFRTGQTGIGCTDTTASLTGRLYDQTAVTGTDSIQPVHCK